MIHISKVVSGGVQGKARKHEVWSESGAIKYMGMDCGCDVPERTFYAEYDDNYHRWTVSDYYKSLSLTKKVQ